MHPDLSSLCSDKINPLVWPPSVDPDQALALAQDAQWRAYYEEPADGQSRAGCYHDFSPESQDVATTYRWLHELLRTTHYTRLSCAYVNLHKERQTEKHLHRSGVSAQGGCAG